MECLKLTYKPLFELRTHERMPSREAKVVQMFISVDPLAEKTMEPYLYTGNNPIMFTDPTGMSKDDVIITGNMDKEAFNSLQNSVSSELELKMNKRGKVTAKKISEGQLS